MSGRNVVDLTGDGRFGSGDLSSLEEQFCEETGPIRSEDRHVLEGHVVEWADVFLGCQEFAELESQEASVQRQRGKIEEVALPLRGRDREPERFRGLREAAGHRQRERSRDAKEELVGIVEGAAGKRALGKRRRLSSRGAASGFLRCRGREEHPGAHPSGKLFLPNKGQAILDDRIEVGLPLGRGDQSRFDAPVEISVQVANCVTRAPH